jgi:hypothetical protein
MATRRHQWIIDSIEEFIASIEVDGKRTIQLPQWFLPRGAERLPTLRRGRYGGSDLARC